MIPVILPVHLTCAFLATITFWVAGCSRKGGRVHRLAGRWFSWLVYATAATGGTMALVTLFAPSVAAAGAARSEVARLLNDQVMWFVLYVLVILVAPVQHALAVVAAGPNPGAVRSKVHTVLSVAGIVGSVLLFPAAVVWHQWLFLIVAPIGAVVGLRNMRYASRPTASRVEWEREHLTGTITAGVTLHTALLVFGTSRSLGWELSGVWQLSPWTVPMLVGLPLIVWLRRRRKKTPDVFF